MFNADHCHSAKDLKIFTLWWFLSILIRTSSRTRMRMQRMTTGPALLESPDNFCPLRPPLG